MKYGTSNFPSFIEACKYYRPYGFYSFQVKNKIESGEIKIGKPKATEGQRVLEVNENPGLRYYIEDIKK